MLETRYGPKRQYPGSTAIPALPIHETEENRKRKQNSGKEGGASSDDDASRDDCENKGGADPREDDVEGVKQGLLYPGGVPVSEGRPSRKDQEDLKNWLQLKFQTWSTQEFEDMKTPDILHLLLSAEDKPAKSTICPFSMLHEKPCWKEGTLTLHEFIEFALEVLSCLMDTKLIHTEEREMHYLLALVQAAHLKPGVTFSDMTRTEGEGPASSHCSPVLWCRWYTKGCCWKDDEWLALVKQAVPFPALHQILLRAETGPKKAQPSPATKTQTKNEGGNLNIKPTPLAELFEHFHKLMLQLSGLARMKHHDTNTSGTGYMELCSMMEGSRESRNVWTYVQKWQKIPHLIDTCQVVSLCIELHKILDSQNIGRKPVQASELLDNCVQQFFKSCQEFRKSCQEVPDTEALEGVLCLYS